MMRMLLAFAVVGMLAAPAMARPDFPSHAVRPDISNRMAMAQDGRAFTSVEHVDRATTPRPSMVQEAREAHQRAWGDLVEHKQFTPPVKTEISMKMHKGDNITGSQAQAAMPQGTAVQTPKDRMGRAASHFVPPVKTQIALKMHHGDNLLGSSSPAGSLAKPADREGATKRSTSNNPVLSKKQKTDLCRQSGVCIPSLEGSSDPTDKVE